MGRSPELAWVPDCSCARVVGDTSGIANIAIHKLERRTLMAPLWHDNRISRLQHGALSRALSIDPVFVVKRVFHLLSVFHAPELYILRLGELRNSAHPGERR